MENPNNTPNKQKTIETPSNIQALQVTTGTTLTPAGRGSSQVPPPPRAIGPIADAPRHSTSSNTSKDELSPAMLGVIQRIVSATIREQSAILVPARIATPSDVDAPKKKLKKVPS
ncbi:UNVERIFIED_CONTAM: hypothetical protein Slati_1430300 [Sesamum latifolium]|uniref:Uncharacterized protein n=1 Tax=Sesamum latifolium TaxID=2727402 RepID=A0AAW2X662_9LAMI